MTVAATYKLPLLSTNDTQVALISLGATVIEELLSIVKSLVDLIWHMPCFIVAQIIKRPPGKVCIILVTQSVRDKVAPGRHELES